MKSYLINTTWICFALLCLAPKSDAGAPVQPISNSAKAVLPPVLTPEENPWQLSAGLMWRQVEGVSIHQNIETDSGRFFADRQADLDGWGAFVMLESPALIQRESAALTLSLMYSWAGMDDMSLQSPFPGRTVWQNFSLDLHTVSLGPRFVYDTPAIRLSTGAGLAMNWARWDAVTQMSTIPPGGLLSTRTNDDDQYLPGLYLDASAQVRLSARWSLLFMGRYDWARSFQTQHEMANSAVSFHTNLDGWSLMAGLTFRFQ
jgi:hypothetical protein